MTVRPRRIQLALAAVATGTAAALTAAAPAATAATGPRFLRPAELPPHPSSACYAGPVTAGQPDPLPICAGEALPSASRHRTFWTEYDTNAVQVTVVARNATKAADFAALLRRKIRDCAATLEKQDPEVSATGKYYGKLGVEEGAHVYGLHTRTTWGASDVALMSVGRDGRTVTFVKWAQMGDFRHAQVTDFKRTTRTAVDKLY
ncbi:hypothetical protein ABZZ79_30770 [Streptomyces sp. NPDC006458]|uniref:hypothetical protein n=1 Tax=Streptomyces sp. NPDC006458 TaxID=3154302 RepID=UPI0033B3C2CE